MSEKRRFLTVREVVLFAMLGTIMFLSKLVMEALPNIHLVGALTMAYTVVYRSKALIPIYIFVILTGIYTGFSPWNVHYIYVWAVLWGVTMLLPRKMSRRASCVVYPLVCALHGLFSGVLGAPAHAMVFGLDFRGMLTLIVAGAAFDITHGIGNFVAGLLILPLSELLLRLEEKSRR